MSPNLRLEASGSPTGLRRLLFRSPIPLFRLRLGFLFGKRFVMLEHQGRTSGKTRRTVLEVVADHPDAVYVAAGWGAKAQWLRNIVADPHVTVYLGSSRFRTFAERIDPVEAGAAIAEYAAAHPKTLARLAAFMLEDPGEGPQEQARRLAASVPFVRLPKTR